MSQTDRSATGRDHALAVLGVAVALGPAALVALRLADWRPRVVLGVLALLAAGVGTGYNEVGGDVGDLGRFVMVLVVAAVGLAVPATILAALVGMPVGLPAAIVASYGVAYWYAFAGGRERFQGDE